MSNFPTFLLATNEKAEPGQDYILHTGRPAFLAQVYEFISEQSRAAFHAQFMEQCEAANFPFIGSQTRRPANGKYYYFVVVQFFQGIDPDQKSLDKLARKARRMSDFYLFNVLQK